MNTKCAKGYTPRRGEGAKRRSSSRLQQQSDDASNVDNAPSSLSIVDVNTNDNQNQSANHLCVPTAPTVTRSTYCASFLPQPAMRLWTSRSRDVTCLSFLLDPTNPVHATINCNKCTRFFEVVLKYDLSKVTEILRSKRGEKDYGCEKPWEPDNEFNRLERKQIAYHNFLRFFDENAEAIAAASNAPPSLSISPADAMDTSTYNIANERNIPNDPPVLSNNHQSSSPPHRPIPESQSQADDNQASWGAQLQSIQISSTRYQALPSKLP